MATIPEQFGWHTYWRAASSIIERVVQTQIAAVQQAGERCTLCLQNNGIMHVYGTGHSRAFAMELAGRAGGLVPVNRLDLEDLALFAGWPLSVVKRPDIERNIEAGRALLSCYTLQEQDIFLIASQSGVNAAVIEVAQQIKQRQHFLIVITSLAHSQQVASRHPSGYKLFELADIVIDNCGPMGDALLELPDNVAGNVCAVSSLTGALIGQMLVAEIVGRFVAEGKVPPVFLSANVPGGIEHNQQLVQQYKERLHLEYLV